MKRVAYTTTKISPETLERAKLLADRVPTSQVAIIDIAVERLAKASDQSILRAVQARHRRRRAATAA